MERNTKQRGAIIKVLKEAEGPLTPQEIQGLAEAQSPGLGIATVYRLLKTMQADESVLLVNIPGTAPRYEDAQRPHHHHFHCRICEKAFELEHCLAEVDTLAPKNFKVESHEIVLYGSCDKCVAKGK